MFARALILLSAASALSAHGEVFALAGGGPAALRWPAGDRRSLVLRDEADVGWQFNPSWAVEVSCFSCGEARNTRSFFFPAPTDNGSPTSSTPARWILKREVHGATFGPAFSGWLTPAFRWVTRQQIAATVDTETGHPPSVDPGIVIGGDSGFRRRNRTTSYQPSLGCEWQPVRWSHIQLGGEVLCLSTPAVRMTALVFHAGIRF